jgi:hypothetical protein
VVNMQLEKRYRDNRGNIFRCILLGPYNAVVVQETGHDSDVGWYYCHDLNGEDLSDFGMHLIEEVPDE